MTAESAVAEIEASGGTALGVEADVRDHEAAQAMVGRVVEESGRVDVLVAIAGGGRGRLVDTKASTLDQSLVAGNRDGEKCPEGDLHEGSRNRLGRVVNRHSPTDKWTPQGSVEMATA